MADIITFVFSLLVLWHIAMGIGMAIGAVIYVVWRDIFKMWWDTRWYKRYRKW